MGEFEQGRDTSELNYKELHGLKQENDKLRMSSEMLIKQLELALGQNLKSGNSQRVFALRFCIAEIKKACRGK